MMMNMVDRNIFAFTVVLPTSFRKRSIRWCKCAYGICMVVQSVCVHMWLPVYYALVNVCVRVHWTISNMVAYTANRNIHDTTKQRFIDFGSLWDCTVCTCNNIKWTVPILTHRQAHCHTWEAKGNGWFADHFVDRHTVVVSTYMYLLVVDSLIYRVQANMESPESNASWTWKLHKCSTISYSMQFKLNKTGMRSRLRQCNRIGSF